MRLSSAQSYSDPLLGSLVSSYSLKAPLVWDAWFLSEIPWLLRLACWLMSCTLKDFLAALKKILSCFHRLTWDSKKTAPGREAASGAHMSAKRSSAFTRRHDLINVPVRGEQGWDADLSASQSPCLDGLNKLLGDKWMLPNLMKEHVPSLVKLMPFKLVPI